MGTSLSRRREKHDDDYQGNIELKVEKFEMCQLAKIGLQFLFNHFFFVCFCLPRVVSHTKGDVCICVSPSNLAEETTLQPTNHKFLTVQVFTPPAHTNKYSQHYTNCQMPERSCKYCLQDQSFF